MRLSTCAPLCCKYLCCVSRFCTGVRGTWAADPSRCPRGHAANASSGAQSETPRWSWKLGHQQHQDQKTRMVSTSWISPGGLSLSLVRTVFHYNFAPDFTIRLTDKMEKSFTPHFCRVALLTSSGVFDQVERRADCCPLADLDGVHRTVSQNQKCAISFKHLVLTLHE